MNKLVLAILPAALLVMGALLLPSAFAKDSSCVVESADGKCILKSFTKNGDVKNNVDIIVKGGSGGGGPPVDLGPILQRLDALEDANSNLTSNDAAQDVLIAGLQEQVSFLENSTITDIEVVNGTVVTPPPDGGNGDGGNGTEGNGTGTEGNSTDTEGNLTSPSG